MGDLYSLSQTFPHSAMALEAESISFKTVYELLNLNVSIPQVCIMSDRLLWKKQLATGRDLKGRRRFLPVTKVETYRTDMENLTRSFYPTATSSAVKMTFRSELFDEPYFECTKQGGEPLEPRNVEIHLNTNLEGKPPWYKLTYATSFDKNGYSLDTSTNTVYDDPENKWHIIRTVGQKLRLKKAIYTWEEFVTPTQRCKRKHEPHLTWKTADVQLGLFESLGMGEVHVEAVFKKYKGFLEREWLPMRQSVTTSISLSFENLELPTEQSLLKLFPNEAIAAMSIWDKHSTGFCLSECLFCGV